MATYENLPGFSSVFKDGGLSKAAERTVTKSVLILGEADSATAGSYPVNQPLAVRDKLELVEKTYGNGIIYKQAIEAYNAGCRDIRVCAIESNMTEYNVSMNTSHSVDSMNGDTLPVSGDPGTEGSIVVAVDASITDIDTTTVVVKDVDGNVVQQGSTDPAYDSVSDTLTISLDPESGVADGDELSIYFEDTIVPDLYHKFAKAYDYLVNYEVDIVVPVGVHVDDSTYDYGMQLAKHCARASESTKETVGVIGTSLVDPTQSPTLPLVKDHVDSLNGLSINYEHNGEDLGRLVNIVQAEIIHAGEPLSGVGAYAGLLSTLQPKSAPTNKAVPVKLRYDLSMAQLNALAGNKIVSFRRKGNLVVVTDAPTAAQPSSDYSRYSTVAIVNDCVNAIRQAGERFIGEGMDIPQENALATAIDDVLARRQEEGSLRNYAFNLVISPRDRVSGNATIELSLVPAFELRRISIEVKLRPEL